MIADIISVRSSWSIGRNAEEVEKICISSLLD
jgi:hypothetical protein